MSGAAYRVSGADQARLESLRQGGVAVPAGLGGGRHASPRDLRAAIAAWQADLARLGHRTKLEFTRGWSHWAAWEVIVIDEGRPEDRYEDTGFYAEFGFAAAGEDNAQPFVCQARTDSPALDILWRLSQIVGPLILEETDLPPSDRGRKLLKAIFGPTYQEKEWKARKPTFVLHSQTDPAEVEGAFE
jgi:hypothetical protein